MSKIFIKLTCAFIFLMLLSSCSYQNMADKLVPKEESKWAEDYIFKLREGDFEYIESHLSEELKAQVSIEILQNLVGYFRTGELISTKIIGSQVHVLNGEWQGNFTFELEYTDGWNLANTAFKKVNGNHVVVGINVYQTEASQEELNAFTFSDKSLAHYLILAFSLITLIFILVTAVVCFRTPIKKRKWLWVIFTLLGVGSIHLNWTTGEIGTQLFSFNLLGVGVVSTSPYAPLIMTLSLPLGAIMFWLKRKFFIEAARDEQGA